ncbi:MAG: hypothetical protein BWX60_01024 [Candidatus Marinimicrobia bacterium ADurb.Bin030]|nr:MAG: hypothetical protein BWX60_01024 [Candidatus Marinimicrobia bacterium ADurb.Bin030]
MSDNYSLVIVLKGRVDKAILQQVEQFENCNDTRRESALPRRRKYLKIADRALKPADYAKFPFLYNQCDRVKVESHRLPVRSGEHQPFPE